MLLISISYTGIMVLYSKTHGHNYAGPCCLQQHLTRTVRSGTYGRSLSLINCSIPVSIINSYSGG